MNFKSTTCPCWRGVLFTDDDSLTEYVESCPYRQLSMPQLFLNLAEQFSLAFFSQVFGLVGFNPASDTNFPSVASVE